MKGIADTGFLVAFANRNDRYHVIAVDREESLVVAAGVRLPSAAYRPRLTAAPGRAGRRRVPPGARPDDV